MSDTDVCSCGDVRDEHGGDPDYPASTACACEGCGCVAFELAVPCDCRDYDNCDECLNLAQSRAAYRRARP